MIFIEGVSWGSLSTAGVGARFLDTTPHRLACPSCQLEGGCPSDADKCDEAHLQAVTATGRMCGVCKILRFAGVPWSPKPSSVWGLPGLLSYLDGMSPFAIYGTLRIDPCGSPERRSCRYFPPPLTRKGRDTRTYAGQPPSNSMQGSIHSYFELKNRNRLAEEPLMRANKMSMGGRSEDGSLSWINSASDWRL
jgi:hypothetical protein